MCFSSWTRLDSVDSMYNIYVGSRLTYAIQWYDIDADYSFVQDNNYLGNNFHSSH